MDLHLVPGAEPTPAERAALDPCSARPRRLGRRRAPARAGGQHRRAAGHAARGAPPPAAAGALGACRSASAGSARAALNELCRAADVPPADAYGVATFYAMLAVEPRPRARRPRLRGHRLPLQRLRRADRAARGALRRRGRAVRRRLGDLVPQPVPRPVRPRAGGARRRSRATRRDERDARARRPPPRVLDVLAGGEPGPRARSPSLPQAGDPALRLLRRVGGVDPTQPRRLPRRTAATRRCAARSSSAPRA